MVIQGLQFRYPAMSSEGRTMGRWLVFVFALTLAATLASAAAADNLRVYKWIDAQGIVHYSDKPPAKIDPSQYLLRLPKLPPIDPREIAAIQARTARINAMLKQLRKQDEQEQQTVRQPSQQPIPKQTRIERVVTAVPVYLHYPNRHTGRRFHRDGHNDGRSQPGQSRKSSTPTWPFPYNLQNNSSFPEEWHPSSSH